MKQLKALLLASIAMLFTTNANAVNMAPIITYLLSDTVRVIPPTACDINMTLDVNETTVICEWKYLPSANDTSTAIVLSQGNYGTFNLSGDSLTYTKDTESNETDSGVLEITSGIKTTAVEVEINALYWKQVSPGSGFTVAVKSDGTIWSWGSNGNGGQLGDGTFHDSLVPVQEFTKGTDWMSVSAGGSHAVAIKSNGTLWSWGSNQYGKLGDGTEDRRLVPTQEITKATNWSSVDAGYYHTVALKSDGSLWAWGRNYNGQLGDGTETDRNVSTQEVTGATDWISVSAGQSSHTAALKSDGTLWLWGSDSYGQLCNTIGEDRNISTQEITEATDWIAVSTGYYFTTALKSDGTIWSCGYGYTGALGDGTGTASAVPVQEFTKSMDWVYVSAGYYHAHATKSDGTLWSWGKNDHGQLADSTEDNKLVPTQEATGNMDWVSVSAGSSNAHATKSDGTLWGWGYNLYGQLGDGTVVDRNVSTPILPRDYD